MTEKKITIGYIEKCDGSLRLNLLKNKLFQKSQFILVIQSNSKDFSKFMIYPLNVNKILKITVSNVKEIVKELEQFYSILKDFNIIHNTGLTVRKDIFVVEIYLNLRFSDSKYKDLKTSLDKIKNKYIDIDIEEISLNI
ncbi:MAG: hypothetical protein KGD73_03500 [Candidatus Lokiarchaeota archaeon]|nr:hypothetical protein [Candidatus Lokiarchaeota archaeon]